MKYTDLDLLSEFLGLSNYQTTFLKNNYNKYDISRLEKRGGVLCVPYVYKRNRFIDGIYKFLFGTKVDLIGKKKLLLRAQKKVKFFAQGYHSVKVGDFIYYADKNGKDISREEFMRAVKESVR